MAEKTGFLNCQPIQQGRPLHRTAGTIGYLPVIRGVVHNAQLAHPRTQIGLQKCPAPLIENNPGTLLKQHLPVTKLRG